jgi:hypothetical protein
MGFLDNLALRKAERSLRPFMMADERIIEYDIADVDPIGKQIPVVLSNRALYFLEQRSEQGIRVPYANIMDVESKGNLLIGLATSTGNSYVIRVIGTPRGDIYETISHHLDQVIKHRQVVDVPGGQVEAWCRKLKEDGDLTWVFYADAGVDLGRVEVKHILSEALAPASKRLGARLHFE